MPHADECKLCRGFFIMDIFETYATQQFGQKCVREFRFHPVRKWRFDYAFPSLKIAIEIDGGVWTQGRHTRPQGYINDLEKFNHAAAMGWLVLKFRPGEQFGLAAEELIAETLKQRL